MAKSDYSQDIKDLQNSLSYYAIHTDDLNNSALKILGKAYSAYESYWSKLFPDDRIDPRIIDVYSFQKYVAGSGEIERLILKLTELNDAKEADKEIKPKEQEASIPPELESLVAEYEQNKALLEAEEIKSNDQKSVAQQVKIAIAHRQIVDRAQANRERRTEAGEKFQTEDEALVNYGSPKSESRTAALATSYKAVQEVAFNNEHFNQLSPAIQNRIISEAVDLNTISVTNINVAIESAALLIDTSDLSPEEQKDISAVSSNYVHSVYDAVNTQTQQAATYEAQITENEIVLLQMEKESQSLQGKALEDKSLQIKSLVSLNQNLSHKIDSLPHQFDVFVNNQTTNFQQFQKDSQARLQKDQDLLDRIDLANKSIASLHENLENHGVKPHLYSPLDEASLLEAAIRHDMPGILRPNAGFAAEETATIAGDPRVKNQTLLSPFAIRSVGMGLTPKLLAQAHQFAQNNPDSALGKLFKNHQDIFDAVGPQIRKIIASPLGKEITQVSTGLGKTFGSISGFFGKINDRIPGGLGSIFRLIQDPWGAFRSWAGRKAGEYVLRQLGKKLTNEALQKISGLLLKEGLQNTVKKLVTQAVIKGAAKLGIELAASSTGVGIVVAVVIEIGSWIIEKVVGAVKALEKSIYGEEIKPRDLLAVPAMGLAAIISFLGTLGTATVAAVGSAVGLIVAGTLVGLFFYIVSFAVAPLLSTLVQLQSTTTSAKAVNSCANLQGIYVSQRDPTWAHTYCTNCSTAGSCDIGGSGCSSASMTMILKSFGIDANVVDIWNKQHALGGYVYSDKNGNPETTPPYDSCGSDNDNSLKILTNSGLAVTYIGTSMAEADKVIDNCGLILASGYMKCTAGACGHLLVITGHDGDQITTDDPWYGENYVHTLGNTFTIRDMWAVVP